MSRNLLLINLQTNACISAADALKLKTGTVFREGKIVHKFWIKQQKVKYSQFIILTPSLRMDIRAVIKEYAEYFDEDYFSNPNNPLFPSQRVKNNIGEIKPMSYSAYRSMLIKIMTALKMDLKYYGTQSLRSALPYAYLKNTGDVKGARALYKLKTGRTTTTYAEEGTPRKAIEIRKELLFSD